MLYTAVHYSWCCTLHTAVPCTSGAVPAGSSVSGLPGPGELEVEGTVRFLWSSTWGDRRNEGEVVGDREVRENGK